MNFWTFSILTLSGKFINGCFLKEARRGNTDNILCDEIDFENIQAQPTTFTPAEITQEEKDKVKELMDKLGL